MNNSLQKTSSAVFQCDLDKSFTENNAPKYRRTDWKGFTLPREPSLKLINDELFFDLIDCYDLDQEKEKANRDLVTSGSNHSCRSEASSEKHTAIPLHIRKQEIECVQRKLPRYPSQTHLSSPSFYPLASCHIPKTKRRKKKKAPAIQPRYPSQTHLSLSEPTFYPLKSCHRPETSERKKKVFLAESNEYNISATKFENKYLKEKEGHDFPKLKKIPKRASHLQIVTTIEIEHECPRDKEDNDLPEREEHTNEMDELSEQVSWAQFEKDYTATLEKINECVEDEQEIEKVNVTISEIANERLEDLSATQDLTEIESYEYIDEDVSESDFEIEYYEDEEDFDILTTQLAATTTEIKMEQECPSDDEEYLDESYYSDSSEEDSDYSEDEVDMAIDDIFEGLLNEMKVIHSENIEYIDHQLMNSMNSSVKADEDLEGSISYSIGESSRSHTEESSRSCINESSFSSTALSPRTIVDDEPYEPKIGVVPPMVRAMIIQARFEFRGRKIPDEHRRKFKPSLAQASVVGQATRLDEYIVEAFGRRVVKHDTSVLPSAIWVKGAETVSLPNLQDQSRTQFQIFKEAVALGGIKALKPKITTNYDPVFSTEASYDDEVDVDDTNRHKLIRIKYLTDIYLHQEHADRIRSKSMDEDDLEDLSQYENLDDVELPTSNCPTYVCVKTDIRRSELKDELAQQVAEAVWDRRYRLERPRAHQRITYRCSCKYCKTSTPYQTRAYRKKWLIQQKLWKEPSQGDTVKKTDLETMKEPSLTDSIRTTDRKLLNEPLVDDSITNMNLKVTKEQSGDDHIIETDVKIASNRTVTTRKSSTGEFSEFDLQMSSELEKVDTSVGISDNTVSSSDSHLSDGFAIEDIQYQENNASLVSESSEVVFDCKNSSVEMIGNSTRSDKKGAQKLNRKKSFMREIQSVLGLSQHGHRSTKQIEDCLKKRVQESEKMLKKSKNKRTMTKGINNMRSMFSSSSPNSKSASRDFARAA